MLAVIASQSDRTYITYCIGFLSQIPSVKHAREATEYISVALTMTALSS